MSLATYLTPEQLPTVGTDLQTVGENNAVPSIRLQLSRHATVPLAQLLRRITDQLAPTAGTRPQPICPPWCWTTHRDDQDHAA